MSRRLLPYLVEATVVPTALYYIGMATWGLVWGIVAAGIWTAVAVLRRLVGGVPVPGLLVLAALGVAVRVGIYLLNDNSFVFFVQPIIRTTVTSLFFALSVMSGRPMVARFANDFCAFGADVGGRPAIVSLFRRLTFLWAGAQAAIAAVNLTLLLTVPVTVFVGVAAGVAWVIMGAGVVITVSDAVRTTRRDGLRTAVASGGRLHAYVVAI